MNIEQLLAGISAEKREQDLLVPESWGQGRTTYGGLTAALMFQAAAENTDPARPVKSYEVSLVRPFETNTPFSLDVETLANGRTVTIKSVRLTQADTVRAIASVSFVLPLQSSVSVDDFTPPALNDRSQSIAINQAGLPAFFQHFDNYLATPGIPFSGHTNPELGGWMRFREPPKAFMDAHLIALIDSWPPTITPCHKAPRPLSTLNWVIHFNHSVSSSSATDHLGYHARVNFGHNGHSASEASIWNPAGELLARSFQTSIIYE